MTRTLADAAASLRAAVVQASRGLIEREALVEVIALAAVAREHLLVIGPPGTGKSQAVHRFSKSIGGAYFEYLLGRFTEPSEVFGPVDIQRLKDGVYESVTTGMLPEAQVAFLDEVFQGSTAILNTLLGILNERRFRRGNTRVDCPLRVCIGASNDLPEEDSLAAFADRFLLRVFVEPVQDPRLEELLEGGWQAAASTDEPRATIGDVDLLADAVSRADVGPVRDRLAHAIRLLRGAGIVLSDRRAVKVQRIIAAAAVLDGRESPTDRDLWPLVLAVPTAEGQAMARDCLRDVLQASENEALQVAAEEASQGTRARAFRIGAAGRELLARQPSGDDSELQQTWQLKLEGIAREIDAGFPIDALPEELLDMRQRIVSILGDDVAAADGSGDTAPATPER